MKTTLTDWIGLASLLLVVSSAASAQTPVSPTEARLAAIEQRLSAIETRFGIQTTNQPADIAERLEALDQQVRIVGRQRELDQDAAAAKSASTATVDASRDGFTIRSSDNNFQLRLGGYIQADGRFFVGPDQIDTSTFILRRIRPIIPVSYTHLTAADE